MNPQKVQLFWTALVAVAAALIGIHNLFAQQSSSTHVFSEVTSSPSPDLIKDAFEFR
jgi:hypothetical protein